jgi:oxygen-independent coproporphyrinogen-3 oxidase
LAESVVRLHRRGEVALAALPPLALYLHLPWCLRKCPYCDFNSHETRAGELPFDAYVDALVADLELALPQVWGRRVVSVFLGGGTPSLFPPAAIERLLAAVRARLPLEPGAEVTLEANPGSFERDRFRAYRDAGVSRLSLGVQSFDDTLLARIGRVHDARQALAAAEEAARCYASWNLDLMYALPGQTPAMLGRDLAQALALAPPHFSAYHLTLEPNTRFATQPPPGLPDDDTAAAMLDLVVERCAAAGLARYEVSAYARPGHGCRHNLNYWRYGDYLGLGAGAHGKLSFADRIVRQQRWRDPATYLQRVREGRPVSSEHTVAAAELPFEFALNALRLRAGFDLALFTERTGQPAALLAEPIERARARGLVEVDATHVRPTALGFDFLSDLQALFLPG